MSVLTVTEASDFALAREMGTTVAERSAAYHQIVEFRAVYGDQDSLVVLTDTDELEFEQDVMHCDECGFTYRDNTPAGRCPNEYDHDDYNEWAEIAERREAWVAEHGDDIDFEQDDEYYDGLDKFSHII